MYKTDKFKRRVVEVEVAAAKETYEAEKKGAKPNGESINHR